MSIYGPRDWSMAVYAAALRRAEGATRRGLKADTVYWMKIADQAHRIMLQRIAIRQRQQRLDALKPQAVRPR